MKAKLTHWLHAWGPALVWMGVLFYLSSREQLPQPPHPLINTILRKGGHAAAFGLLALLYARGLHYAGMRRMARIRLAWLLTALYALSDELHQGFTPGRHPTVGDWLIDMAGATVALALLWRWLRKSAPEAPTVQ